MSSFVGFWSSPRCPGVGELVRSLTAEGSHWRVLRSRDRRLTLCLPQERTGRNNGFVKFAVWRDAGGGWHLEQAGTQAPVWLRYDPHAVVLTLGRALAARGTIYYAREPGSGALVFSSSLEPVLALARRKRELSPVGLGFFLALSGTPAPLTLFDGVRKLGPGHTLRLGPDVSLPSAPWGAALPPARSGKLDAAEVRRRLESEVAQAAASTEGAGIVLSGGLDSTCVADALVRADVAGRPRALTLAYPADSALADLNWDRRYAEEVASGLGLPLDVVTLDERISGWAMAGFLLRHSDEPVADPAMVPLFLLSSFARERGIRDLWDGRGADELFSLENSWWKGAAWWIAAGMPPALLAGLGRCAQARAGDWRRRRWFSAEPSESALWYECLRWPEELRELVPDFPWEELRSYFRDLAERAGTERAPGVAQRSEWEVWFAEQNQPMVHTLSKLTGVHFHSPFGAESLVRYAFSVPLSGRVPWMRPKALLRKAFRRDIPRAVLRRRKKGLPTPLRLWLRRAEPFLGRYLRDLQDYYGRRPVDWEQVGRWLKQADRDPSFAWLLMTLVLWLHGKVLASVDGRPATETAGAERARTPTTVA